MRWAGVQVRFGVLNAGNFGVSQSRKRTFIWGAAPDEELPNWPRALTVFKSPQLKISIPNGEPYTAIKDGKHARLRAVTVLDTIGDLPAVKNGESECVPLLCCSSTPVLLLACTAPRYHPRAYYIAIHVCAAFFPW